MRFLPLLLLTACLDLTVTVRGPCRSVVVRDTTADTLLVATVDSLPCPR